MAEEISIIEKDAPNGETPKKSKFFTWDLAKCIIVLAAIALVAGALLGAINYVTYVDPDETIMGEVAGFYGVATANIAKDADRVVNGGTKSETIACFVAKDDAGADLGYCYYTSGANSKDGTIELLVYIDKEGVIKDIAVYEQNESAGYFNKVEKANKDKYVGADLDEVTFFMNNSKSEFKEGTTEIAAKSGATYTSRGYHNAICAAVYSYQNYNKEVA